MSEGFDNSGFPADMAEAEKRAFVATKLSAFPINLLDVRRTVRLGDIQLKGEKEFLGALSSTNLAIFDPFERSARPGFATPEELMGI